MTHGTPRTSPQVRPLGQSTTLVRQVLSILIKLGIRTSILRKGYVFRHFAVLHLIAAHSMTHPHTRSLTCPKVVHQMNHHLHLLKLPIHHGGANVLGPRSISHFVVSYSTDHGSAYSRSSGLCTGEPTQP